MRSCLASNVPGTIQLRLIPRQARGSVNISISVHGEYNTGRTICDFHAQPGA